MCTKKLGCVFLLLILCIARNTVAKEVIHTNKHTANYSANETDVYHIFSMSTLNQRFKINQARDEECKINSSINEFPEDLFTNESRQNGAILLHLFGAVYFFTLLAVVCNDYFLPSVECICDDLNISKDVAAATFMSIATTTPELFTNVISTFLMDSNMGLGTIIGSLMFNTLGVAGLAGLAAIKPVKLEWWPITRDCTLYSLNVLILIWFSWDSKITLLESIALVLIFFIYFVILFQNNRILKFIMNIGKKATEKYNRRSYDLPSSNQFKTLQEKFEINNQNNNNILSETNNRNVNKFPSETNDQNDDNSQSQPCEIYYICDTPDTTVRHDSESLQQQVVTVQKAENRSHTFKKWFRTFWWLYTWPIKFVLSLAIPNPATWRKLYPFTFVLSVAAIGANSYLIVWMITVMGYTYSIPESVMGITLLAAGGCMPEAISSVLMIRKGEGGIGVSNSLGANSLAILMSCGVPWLIRNIIYRNTSDNSFVSIGSDGIEFPIMSLLVATILLYSVLSIAKYNLNKRVGFSLISIYSVFLTISVLFELGIIFPKLCQSF